MFFRREREARKEAVEPATVAVAATNHLGGVSAEKERVHGVSWEAYPLGKP
jgi:hypothetical protein